MRLKLGRFEAIAERCECDSCGTAFRVFWRINQKPKPRYIPTAEEIALRKYQLSYEYLEIIAPLPKDAA